MRHLFTTKFIKKNSLRLARITVQYTVRYRLIWPTLYNGESIHHKCYVYSINIIGGNSASRTMLK